MSRAKGLISFEGIEGSGKSTQSRLFAEYLRGRGYNVVHTAEPGGTDIGQKIRVLLLDPQNNMDALTELLLYYASRAQHVQEIIIPAIDNNKIVVTDRFTDSTIAYQGYARGVSMDIIHSLNDIVVSEVKPSLTFLLDTDVREGLRRNRDAMKEDRFELETIAFHERVRQGFHEIAALEPERVKIIDASHRKEDVTQHIIKVFEQSWH